MSKFRMRRAPSKPRRGTIYKEYRMEDGETLAAVMKNGSIPLHAKFSHELGEWDDPCYGAKFVWEEEEPEEVFQKRVEAYKKELSEYGKWKRTHTEEIAKFLEEEKQKKAVAEEKSKKEALKITIRRKKIVEQELESLKKELEQLES